ALARAGPAPPLPIHFPWLKENFRGRTVYDGHPVEVSDGEARLRSPLALPALSNLKITITASPLGNPTGEVYAKVLDSTPATPSVIRIRFTSVTPELKAWMSG